MAGTLEADRLPSEIDPDTLRKYFTLTELDVAQIHQCRGVLNKAAVRMSGQS
jgi:hypothetical protein